MPIILRGVLCCVVSLSAFDAVLAAVRDMRKIALLGEPAPLTNGDQATFDTFWSRGINNDGDVAFTGRLDSSVGNRYGIWVTESGVLNERVRAGQPAPGVDPDGTALFSGFSSTSIAFNDQGDVGYLGYSNQPASSGYWISSPMATAPVAVRGTPVIGYDWTYYSIDYAPAMNNQGQMASNLSIIETGSSLGRYGIFVNDAAHAEPVVLQGEPAVGAAGVFSSVIRTDPPINESGHTAFQIGIIDSSSGQQISSALYKGSAQSLDLVAMGGAEAPGTNATFAGFTSYSGLPINNNADTVFNALLQGDGVTTSNNQGIWRTRGEHVELIARKGDVAIPATSEAAEAVFTGFNYSIIDDTDQVVFAATLGGVGLSSQSTTLWSARGDELKLLARPGMPAPGTSDLFTSVPANGFSTNRLGQVVFLGTAGGKTGLWAQDPGGDLRLIVRTGDAIEVGPGVSLTITALEGYPSFGGFRSSGGSDGRARIINDAGQILFGATLDNGQKGLFVSDLAGYYTADFDGDGDVDGDDLAQWTGDFGDNADSDGADFLTWQQQFGSGVPAVDAAGGVPEPRTCALVFLAVLAVVSRRSGPALGLPALRRDASFGLHGVRRRRGGPRLARGFAKSLLMVGHVAQRDAGEHGGDVAKTVRQLRAVFGARASVGRGKGTQLNADGSANSSAMLSSRIIAGGAHFVMRRRPVL